MLITHLSNVLTVLFCLIFLAFTAQAEENEPDSVSDEAGETEETIVPPPPRIGHLNSEYLRQQFLAEETKPSELVWLDVNYPAVPDSGKPPPPGTKVLALQRKAHTPEQHGAALILHDKEQHADWPSLVRPMRTTLPESGWFTLSVNLPLEKAHFDEAPQRSFPAKQYDEIVVSDALRQLLLTRQASEGSEQSNASSDEDGSEETQTDAESVAESDDSAATDNEATGPGAETEEEQVDIDLADPEESLHLIPYKDRALAHIEAGVEYLRQQGYQNIVVIAHRSSVDTVMTFLEKTKGQYGAQGFALVMIDPILSERFQEDIAIAFGKGFPAPILEIVTRRDDYTQQLASERLVAARLGEINRYQAIDLPFSTETMNQAIPRRVKFWLEKNAPGMVMQGRKR